MSLSILLPFVTTSETQHLKAQLSSDQAAQGGSGHLAGGIGVIGM